MGTPALHEEEAGKKHGTILLDLDLEDNPHTVPALTETPEEYKSHSLAARTWGAIPVSARPIPEVTAEEAQNRFLKGMLDTPTARDERNPIDLLISLAVHVAIVAAVILIPLAFTQAIDFQNLRATYLAMPRPPAAAPAPRPPAMAAEKRSFHALQPSAITMPTIIPRKVVQFRDEAAPEIGGVGVAGGIEGGETGGVLGGILGGAAPAPPPQTAAKKTVYRVGGDVKPPRELLRVAPVYSPIARTARVQGTVQIDAIIDENGNVVHARAVSGPGLLIPPALEAVMKWKYEPTYLDGAPVPIEMQVQVNFHLE